MMGWPKADDLKRDLIGRAPLSASALATYSAYTPETAYRAAQFSWLTYLVFDEGLADKNRDLYPSITGRPGLFSLPQFEMETFVVDTYFVKVLGVRAGHTVFVAFRGSRSFYDWVQNSKAALYPELEKCPSRSVSGDSMVRVHSGFRQLTHSIRPLVRDHLQQFGEKKDRVFLCGHSLGGALATLFAAYEGHDVQVRDGYSPINGVYSFGAPRIGSGPLAGFIGVPHHRIVMAGDVVPHLPPRLLGFRDDCVAHVLEDPVIVRPGRSRPMTDSMAARQVRPFSRGVIANHSIERYVCAVGSDWNPTLPQASEEGGEQARRGREPGP